MTPIEIQRLMKQSPEMLRAYREQPNYIWRFLRDDVESVYVTTICVQCRQVGILLETPYRPDLCINCLLALLRELQDDPIIEKYRDKRSRDYDAEYDQQCKAWDELDTVYLPEDYDGPPIAIA